MFLVTFTEASYNSSRSGRGSRTPNHHLLIQYHFCSNEGSCQLQVLIVFRKPYLGVADFHADLERMHSRGWEIEVISWRHTCNTRMRMWAQQRGSFIALDDYYESVTLLEPPAPGQPVDDPRYAVPVDLSTCT